ncbi:MAG: hypothetical protein GC150_04670 [Rhizobiales bacterium]|nr:hypothetical protein [Hyphomicrobiales bacterium]
MSYPHFVACQWRLGPDRPMRAQRGRTGKLLGAHREHSVGSRTISRPMPLDIAAPPALSGQTIVDCVAEQVYRNKQISSGRTSYALHRLQRSSIASSFRQLCGIQVADDVIGHRDTLIPRLMGERLCSRQRTTD